MKFKKFGYGLIAGGASIASSPIIAAYAVEKLGPFFGYNFKPQQIAIITWYTILTFPVSLSVSLIGITLLFN